MRRLLAAMLILFAIPATAHAEPTAALAAAPTAERTDSRLHDCTGSDAVGAEIYEA